MNGTKFSVLYGFAAYLVLAWILLLPLSAHMGSRLPDDGDAILGLWIVWSATQFSKGYPGIFDANAFYPHPHGLLYSEPMLSQGLLSWPLFGVFGALDHPVLVMNLLTVLTLALSAVGAQILFRELTGSTYGAIVGAIAYTFSAYTFSQLARIQLITLQWLPLALFCLHRYYVSSRKRYLIGFAAFSILLSLACFYYLAFYLVALAILLPALVWAHPAHRKPHSVAAVGLTGLFVGAVLALVTVPYLVLYRHYGFTSDPESYDLLGYFVPRSGNLLYSFLDIRPQLVDHFIGYAVLMLAITGLVVFLTRTPRGERIVGLAYVAIAVAAFLLSAGPTLRFAGIHLGAGPYALLQPIPPFESLRTPDRFSLLVTLGVGLFVAHGTAWLASRGSGVRRAMVSALLAAVVLAEHWSPRRVQGREIPSGDRVPDVYRWLEAAETGPVAELPARPYREMRHVTLDAYFSIFHEKMVLFNKASFYPPAMEFLQWKLARFPNRESITLMQALGISHAVVHPKRWSDGNRLRTLNRRFPEMALLESFPDRDDPTWDRFRLGGEHLYAVRPLEEVGTPRECDCREIPRESLTLASNGIHPEAFATDGDRSTKWTTGATQRKGDFFEIAFDRPRRPVRIELAMAFPYGEFPRNLEVNGFLEDRGWRLEKLPDVWHDVALVRQLVDDPSAARMRIDLAPRTVERIRLFINVTEEGSQPWSIFEIHVYEPSEPGVLEFPTSS